MNDPIDKDRLICLLSNGVRRVVDLIGIVTDYHGGPATTADMAREFIENYYEIKVECLNKSILNIFTQKQSIKISQLGSTRTDIIVFYNKLIPTALIEIKIGVKTFRKIEDDLIKMISTINLLNQKCIDGVVAASVFQIHISGRTKKKVISDDAINSTLVKIENALREDMNHFAISYPDFRFEMDPLQSHNSGIVAHDPESEQDGHATRYYAITARSLKPIAT